MYYKLCTTLLQSAALQLVIKILWFDHKNKDAITTEILYYSAPARNGGTAFKLFKKKNTHKIYTVRIISIPSTCIQ